MVFPVSLTAQYLCYYDHNHHHHCFLEIFVLFFLFCSQSSSRTLLPDLIKNGVACELRCLHVGDLLWIAREQKPVGGAGCKQELVLNYIIERKRMDDFVHSMTSGRLKEQKVFYSMSQYFGEKRNNYT